MILSFQWALVGRAPKTCPSYISWTWLAACEGSREGTRLQEGIEINKSLFMLGESYKD